MEAGEGGAQGLDRDAFGVTTTGEDLGVDTYGCGEAICGVAMRGEAICGEVICGEVIVVTRCVGSGDATMRVVILVSTAAVVDADVDVPLGPPSLDAPGLPGDVGEAGDVARSAALRFSCCICKCSIILLRFAAKR